MTSPETLQTAKRAATVLEQRVGIVNDLIIIWKNGRRVSYTVKELDKFLDSLKPLDYK